jgi:hypothetical protein
VPLRNLSPDKSSEAIRQVWWTSLEFGESSMEADQGPDKSGGGLWSPARASRIQLEPLESGLRPDKSNGALWSPVKSLWNSMDSSDKSGEAWKWRIWRDKHLDLSPNFFNASLLIVQLSYDLNKI